tara:strand:+ start:716 stop:1543 length:828 start_codon:yes stop_codon:yes gene_type:complete
MNSGRKNFLLKIIIALGIVSLVTSIYLFFEYLFPGLGAVCDFSENVSCSIVNTSSFSKFLGVPLSVFGFIWSGFLILIAKEAKKKRIFSLVLLLWSILGILSVIYLVIAEIILQALCPLCTIVHVCALIILILSIYIVKSMDSVPKLSGVLKLKNFLTILIIINIIPFVLFNLSGDTQNLDSFAQCLTDEGLVIYSSSTCSHCIKQEALFGGSFEYIIRKECNPNELDTDVDLCQEMGIEGTPTWLKESDGVELDRAVGYQSLDELAEWSGCLLE